MASAAAGQPGEGKMGADGSETHTEQRPQGEMQSETKGANGGTNDGVALLVGEDEGGGGEQQVSLQRDADYQKGVTRVNDIIAWEVRDSVGRSGLHG